MSTWHRNNRERLRFYKRAYRFMLEHDDYSLMREYRRQYCPPVVDCLIKKLKQACGYH